MRSRRTAATGSLHTKQGVVVVLVSARQPNIHIERIHIELFTEQGRESSGHPLPHLGARCIKSYGIIGQNLHKRIGGPGSFGSRNGQWHGVTRAAAETEPNHQTPTRHSGGLQKPTTRDVHYIHAVSPTGAIAS